MPVSATSTSTHEWPADITNQQRDYINSPSYPDDLESISKTVTWMEGQYGSPDRRTIAMLGVEVAVLSKNPQLITERLDALVEDSNEGVRDTLFNVPRNLRMVF